MSDVIPIKIFVHVEEPSMKEVAEVVVRNIVGDIEVRIIDHGSKSRLLIDLPNRLDGYMRRTLEDIRVLVLVDRDNDDCFALKTQLERTASIAGYYTKSRPHETGKFRVVNRVVVEELESWFFGDIVALREVFPRLPATLAKRAPYRDPDAISGGTWEALLRVLNQHGYYRGSQRLPKIDVARRLAQHLSIERNSSRSFNTFVSGVIALKTQKV